MERIMPRAWLAVGLVALFLALVAVALPAPTAAQEPTATRPIITPPPRPTLTLTPGPTHTPQPTLTPTPEPPPVVPEASTLLLLGSALATLAGYIALQARARPRG